MFCSLLKRLMIFYWIIFSFYLHKEYSWWAFNSVFKLLLLMLWTDRGILYTKIVRRERKKFTDFLLFFSSLTSHQYEEKYEENLFGAFFICFDYDFKFFQSIGAKYFWTANFLWRLKKNATLSFNFSKLLTYVYGKCWGHFSPAIYLLGSSS